MGSTHRARVDLKDDEDCPETNYAEMLAETGTEFARDKHAFHAILESRTDRPGFNLPSLSEVRDDEMPAKEAGRSDFSSAELRLAPLSPRSDFSSERRAIMGRERGGGGREGREGP